MFKAAADQGIGFYAQIFVRTSLFFAAPLHWGSVFASRLRTRVFNVLFSFVNWILSGSWSSHRVIFSKLTSEPACSSQFDLHWASPHFPWGMERICGPFFRIYLCLSSHFVNQHVFLLLDSHWDSPKLPWGLFTYFTLHHILSYVYYHVKYFSYPWWRCCSEFTYYF